MITITLTEEELNKCLQENREINDNELVNVQLHKDDYILNITTKDGELLFDEEVIFIFIFNDVIKAGRKNGEVIEIDNIISK